MSGEADHILEKLAPEVDAAAPGVAEGALAGGGEEAAAQVVLDLGVQVGLEETGERAGIGAGEVVLVDVQEGEGGAVFGEEFGEGVGPGDAVEQHLGGRGHALGEGVIGGGEDAAVEGAAGDGDEGHAHAGLLVEVDDGFGAGRGVVADAEELLHFFPVEAGVVDLFEAFGF